MQIQYFIVLVDQLRHSILLGNDANGMIVEETPPLLEHESDKSLLLEIGKGKPEVTDFDYQDRACKSIAVFDKVYGQYLR